MNAYRPCKRCDKVFRAMHGNSTLCGKCRGGGGSFKRSGVPQDFGLRRCRYCGRKFRARNAHHAFCCRSHERLGNRAKNASRYGAAHKIRRRYLEELVASGWARCARGRHCKYAEEIDGELVGGLIRPDQPWDVGHADGESAGGAEHAACNRAGPMRLRAKKARSG